MIWLTLEQNVAFNIVNEKTIADLMKALLNKYEKPSVSNKVYLMCWLFNLMMGEGELVIDHIKFNVITTQLSLVNHS